MNVIASSSVPIPKLGVEPAKSRVRTSLLVAGTFSLVALLVCAFVWGPQWVDGIKPGHLGKDDGPRATVVSGFRTAIAAAVVGFAALAGLFLNRATLQQNRRTSDAQFAHTQEQLRLAQKQFELARATSEQNQAVSDRQFVHAQDQFTHAQDQFTLAQKQFRLAQKTSKQNRKKDELTAELTREGQITDRYVKAVGLLSEDAVTTRMAGVYALDRIMRDSAKDHATIVQLLAGFVRERASRDYSVEPTDETEPVGADIAAAVAVVAHRPERVEDFRLDLTSTCLRGLDLNNGRFEGADFNSSDLTRAVLIGANLNRATFYKACLHGAVAHSAKLTNAHLLEAVLCRTDLSAAELVEANLQDADLEWAVLRDADLTGASLAGASLADVLGDHMAVVTAEQVLSATVTSTTNLPAHLLRDPAVLAHIERGDAAFFAGTA